MQPVHFTLDDIQNAVEAAAFERGQGYADEDKVLKTETEVIDNAELSFRATVRGSGLQIYAQEIYVYNGEHGVDVEGHCSCPVAYNCKHVAAVLIHYLQSSSVHALSEAITPSALVTPNVERPLPRVIDNWLQRIAEDRAKIIDLPIAPSVKGDLLQHVPSNPSFRLIFALVPGHNGKQITLHLCRARLRKDGSYSAVKPLSDGLSFQESLRENMQESDHDAVSLFIALSANIKAPSYYQRQASHCELRGKMGAQLLNLLLQKKSVLWANSLADLGKGQAHHMQLAVSRHAILNWRAQHLEEVGDTPDERMSSWGRPKKLAVSAYKPARDALKLVWQFSSETSSAVDAAAAEIIDYVLPTDPPWYINNLSSGELHLPSALMRIANDDLIALVAQAPLLDATNKLQVAQQLLVQGLNHVIPLPIDVPFAQLDAVQPQVLLKLDNVPYVDGSTLDFAQLHFVYDGTLVPASFAPTLQRNSANGIEKIARDPVFEAAAQQVLLALHFQATPSDHPLAALPGAFVLPDQSAWLRFNHDGITALQEQGWQINKSSAYRFDVSDIDDWYADIDEASDDVQAGNAWFDLELGIVVNQERISLLPLLINLIRQAPQDFNPRTLAQRDDHDELLMRLDSGLRVALPWGRIKPILTTLGELYFADKLIGDSVRLSSLDAARLAELEGSAQMRWMGGERLRHIGRKLNTFGGIQGITVPDGLRATLRGYQMEGVAWMQFLREYDFAGILADDMGLGKTVQTLTHILIEKNAGRLTAPALVVAPTSLMVNWQEEAARFAPHLKVLVLQGKQRLAHFERIPEFDVVLTTYALLPRDEEKLREHAFHLLILDEAHYIKNTRSKAAQSATLIKARHRLCLTGTPLENHLGELWSQFHFLLPGLLGDEKTFNRDFRQPIEKHGDEARRALLVRRIKPFLLRRTKDKVASELPPKTEMVRTVELGGSQRDVYETVRLAMDKKVRDAIATKGLARSHIVILEALLKLRQACCDPRLVKMSDENSAAKHAPSAKLLELMEMVQELLEEDRRILIFSQFTSMLALIAEALASANIAYTMLTGATEDRASVVRAFQQGDVPIFLISLKAGGVGLNLTAADTVIHYDPWWNPAAENQATDRAWRIGQDKPVFVYKLIAKGTVEEKIQVLQQKKSALADAILGDSGEMLDGKLTAEDLQVIFEPLQA